jgi:hypothetical protein
MSEDEPMPVRWSYPYHSYTYAIEGSGSVWIIESITDSESGSHLQLQPRSWATRDHAINAAHGVIWATLKKAGMLPF